MIFVEDAHIFSIEAGQKTMIHDWAFEDMKFGFQGKILIALVGVSEFCIKIDLECKSN